MRVLVLVACLVATAYTAAAAQELSADCERGDLTGLDDEGGSTRCRIDPPIDLPPTHQRSSGGTNCSVSSTGDIICTSTTA